MRPAHALALLSLIAGCGAEMLATPDGAAVDAGVSSIDARPSLDAPPLSDVGSFDATAAPDAQPPLDATADASILSDAAAEHDAGDPDAESLDAARPIDAARDEDSGALDGDVLDDAGDPGIAPDAGLGDDPDSGPPDPGPSDAGAPDGGPTDAGRPRGALAFVHQIDEPADDELAQNLYAIAAHPGGDGFVIGGGYYWRARIQDGPRTVVLERPSPPAYPNELFLARFDAAGRLRWARSSTQGCRDSTANVLGLSFSPDDSITIAASSVGCDHMVLGEGEARALRLALTPITSTGFHPWTGIVARFEPDGRLRWARAPVTMSDTRFEAVAALDEGSVVAVGTVAAPGATYGAGEPGETFEPGIGNRDAVWARYDATGRLTWLRSLTGTCWHRPNAVAVAPGGDLVIAGMMHGSSTADCTAIWDEGETTEVRMTRSRYADHEGIVMRVEPAAGRVRWVRRIGWTPGASERSYNGEDDVHAVAVAADGTIYVVGQIAVTCSWGSRCNATFGVDGPDAIVMSSPPTTFLAALSFDGRFLWARAIGGFTTEATAPLTLLDDGPAVPLTIGGPTLFGEGEPDERIVSPLTACGTDAIVARWAADGTFSGIESQVACAGHRASAVVPGGPLVSIGQFSTTATFGWGGPFEIVLDADVYPGDDNDAWVAGWVR